MLLRKDTKRRPGLADLLKTDIMVDKMRELKYEAQDLAPASATKEISSTSESSSAVKQEDVI